MEIANPFVDRDYGKAFWETGKILGRGGIALATNPYALGGGAIGYVGYKLGEAHNNYINSLSDKEHVDWINKFDPEGWKFGNVIPTGQGATSNDLAPIFNLKQSKINPYYTDIDANVSWSFNNPSFKPSLLIGKDLFEKPFELDILYKKRNDDKLKQKQKKEEVKVANLGGGLEPDSDDEKDFKKDGDKKLKNEKLPEDFKFDMKKFENRNDAPKIIRHTNPKYGKFYKDPKTDMYFTKDTAKHGGSVVKLYKRFGKKVEHMGDIDEFGNLMQKHKSMPSETLYWKDFIGIK